ncbi:MAG TPA: hypothetical protein VMH23_11280 [Bacteroidota bacterium]|nr:hypothetical protein [Bacteroidota bacterium]
MKKLLLACGESFLRIGAVVVIIALAFIFTPSSYSQTTYSLSFEGLPSGTVDLTQYIGLDRKLKTNVAGQVLHISVAPPLTKTQKVRLSIAVSGSGSTVTECNLNPIATATTVAFDISGAGRDLGASDFTGNSGIGVQTSDTKQSCIDALADKMTQGVAAIPAGIYTIAATLNDANTGAILGSTTYPIVILGQSTNEATLNLTSPTNGEQVTQSASVIFQFENSIGGRLLVFEHSTLSQSPDDATADLNSPLKMVDVTFDSKHTGSNQVNAVNPGVALRPWTAGKKYSWYFLGTFGNSSAAASGSAVTKKSPIWSFTVVSSDPLYARLVDALSGAPEPVGSSYQNLASSGYLLNLSSTFYLQEGDNASPKPIQLQDVLTFLRSLAGKNVQIRAGLVTQ